MVEGGGRGRGGERDGGDKRQGAFVFLTPITRRVIIHEWQTYKKIHFGHISLAYCRDFQKKSPQTKRLGEGL